MSLSGLSGSKTTNRGIETGQTLTPVHYPQNLWVIGEVNFIRHTLDGKTSWAKSRKLANETQALHNNTDDYKNEKESPKATTYQH